MRIVAGYVRCKHRSTRLLALVTLVSSSYSSKGKSMSMSSTQLETSGATSYFAKFGMLLLEDSESVAGLNTVFSISLSSMLCNGLASLAKSLDMALESEVLRVRWALPLMLHFVFKDDGFMASSLFAYSANNKEGRVCSGCYTIPHGCRRQLDFYLISIFHRPPSLLRKLRCRKHNHAWVNRGSRSLLVSCRPNGERL